MPGIVVFRRRWSVGSDDLVVPAVFLIALHFVWIIALSVIISVVEFDPNSACSTSLWEHVLGYLVILGGCIVMEIAIMWVSMRGSILDTEPRASMQYLLYIRLVIFLGEVAWLIVGVIWVAEHYSECDTIGAKRAILGIIVCNWIVLLSVIISLCCTFDSAGRSWVKMKRYQKSIKEREQRKGKRSGSRRRNWRHRKAMRKYEESWDRRCRILFCCVKQQRNRNSFSEIAKLFTEFFRDLDVVPSDVVAGLVLLRKHQQQKRKYIVSQGSNDTYEFLSGIPVTPRTRFLHLQDENELNDFKCVIHFFRYALAAYGWPMYMMMNSGTGLCHMTPHLNCCCIPSCKRNKNSHTVLIEDNCCSCNFAAMQQLSNLYDTDFIYVTYHVEIGETPFFVAVDHEHKKIVISIRGTLSLQDVLTDLKADAEMLPIDPPKDDWLGHKGMVHAAIYIKKKLKEEMILSQAFGRDLEKGTQQYDLCIVGHSLGAGTAAILAILLHQEYPNLQCYAYSPPGGLLSACAVEETKSFITSVVVGKDVVSRIGLSQLESLRTDLINVIKTCSQPKWKVIMGTVCCCGDGSDDNSLGTFDTSKDNQNRVMTHPTDSQIALTAHAPLYPPGRIIHIVRNHPKTKRSLLKSADPVYQAIWAENTDFDEVLISPTMVSDHMPDNVMDALEKVLVNVGPAKPTRKLSEAERKALLSPDSPTSTHEHSQPQKILLETSFTNQNLDTSDDLNRSSGCYSNTSEANSLSWDYERSKLTPTEKAAACQREAQNKPNLKLDLTPVDNWQAQAPLATPETLSDTSSVESGSLKRSLNGYQRLTSGIQRMAPIQQSPLRQIKSDKLPGYCYYVEPPSPIDYAELSPLKDKFDFSSSLPAAQSTPVRNCPVSNNNSNGVNTITTTATVETSSSTPPKPPRITHQNGDPKVLTKAPPCSGDRNCNKVHFNVRNSAGSDEEEEEVALDRNKSRSSEKLIPANSQLIRSNGFDCAGDCDNCESLLCNEYDRHSPEFTNQIIYDSVAGHYSQAGRGYPHGGYQAVDMAESESHLPKLALEMELIRTPEEDDLSKVMDSSAPLDGSQRSRLRCYSSPDTRCSTTPEDEYGRRLSQPCSDEVFVEDDGSSWLQESDV